MKTDIHPQYVECTVSCACGSSFKTHSTKPVIRLEICSSCHPFFTGKQKFLDTAGRVERFNKRFEKSAGEQAARKAQPKVVKGQPTQITKKKLKVLSSAPIKIAKPAERSSKPASKPAAPPTQSH